MKKINNLNNLQKSKSEVITDILCVLILVGAITIAATSPYFIINVIKYFSKLKRYPKKKVSDTFYKLKERGFIKIENKQGQIYIELTEKGKKKAGWIQIDNLKIEKPKKWDKKWRMVMFDISQMKRQHREALRSKLKQLGFYLFQKSIWVIPYKCDKEIEMLKNFFGLKNHEIRLITIDDIGEDDELRKFFRVG